MDKGIVEAKIQELVVDTNWPTATLQDLAEKADGYFENAPAGLRRMWIGEHKPSVNICVKAYKYILEETVRRRNASS